MRRIKIDHKDLYKEVSKVLRSGGVVMHPTETCYGFAVDVFNKKALEKLYRIKKLPLDKPVSILVDSFGMAQEYGIFSDKALELANKHWPGPLSILVLRRKDLPDFLNSGEDYVSIRFSNSSFCMGMVKEFGRPVSTTSANVHKDVELYTPEEIDGVDLIVDGGELQRNKPSTIVRVDDDRVVVLRQGEVVVE